MKKIKYKTLVLKSGEGTLVEARDYTWAKKFTWYSDNRGYAMTRLNGKTLRLHRLIMNAEKDEMIDHINGTRLDNRRENLRFCTASENSRNRRANKNSTSHYLGVSWDKAAKKWRACILLNGKNKSIGRYKTEEEAAIAYNELAFKHHPIFSNLNVVIPRFEVMALF